MTHKKRILIVDDVPANIKVLAEAFREDYKISFAVNGPDALKLAAGDQSPDIILLDIMIPGMDGYEVCRGLKENPKTRDIPVIFITAKSQKEDEALGLEIGAVDYITKPISLPIVQARVKTHLELRARNQELTTLDEIVKTINKEVVLGDVLRVIIEHGIVLHPQAQSGFFILPDRQSHSFVCAGEVKPKINRRDLQATSVKRDHLEHMLVEACDEVAPRVYQFRRGKSNAAAAMTAYLGEPCSLLLLGMMVEGKLQGYLVLENWDEEGSFDTEDFPRLIRYRDHAAAAVLKAVLLQNVQEKNEALQRTQKQLVMQEKMASLGTLVAGVAHELKNPLNFVNNFSAIAGELLGELQESIDQLRIRPGDSERIQQVEELFQDLRVNTQTVNEHGLRADHIVRSMMELAGGSAGEWREIPLNPLVEEFAVLAYHGKRAKNDAAELVLETEFDPRIGEIASVPQSLSRVVINLVNNALDAVADRAEKEGAGYQPRIVVRTKLHENREVEICIEDNGGGIPESLRETVFNPFFTTKPTGKGNIGLGLSICFDIIVQEHQGEIRVESEPNQFTRFRVFLPVHRPERVHP